MNLRIMNMIGSPEINKLIRKIFSPVLRENGFSKVETRDNWGWHKNAIWVLKIRAVGRYFSQVTDWPSMSIVVDLGIFYDFIPSEFTIKRDPDGKLLPEEPQCHVRSSLLSTLNQSNLKNRLGNPAERERKDIWWIQPDGSNLEEVINNVKECFLNKGIEWFDNFTDLKFAFRQLEKERDCYHKFYRVTYFAKQLGETKKFEKYFQLLEQEAKRIGRPIPRN